MTSKAEASVQSARIAKLERALRHASERFSWLAKHHIEGRFGQVEANRLSDEMWAAQAGGTRPDDDALRAAPELAGKKALVLYFETDEDAREFSELVQLAKPGMRTRSI